jgi:tRNA U38,U39,U40 pseudouridine synthase TruA
MVRMLTGALTAVSTGAVPLEVLEAGLVEQQPFHCPVAPPEPLTLWSVGIRDSKRRTEREPPHQALSSGVYRFT